MKAVVGIDPGTVTGFAIWCLGKRALLCVESMRITDALVRVQSMQNAGSLHRVVYEDARMHGRSDKGTHGEWMGAGSIRRDCAIWAEWLGLVGCPYKQVSPRAKGAKLDAEQFARLTGWVGRTNEHGRDASMLVFGAMS